MFIVSLNLSTFDVEVRTADETLTEKERHQVTQIFFEDKVKELNGILEESYRKYHFNGHVMVVHHGKIIYNNFIGYADFATMDTLVDGSVYQLASVSKQFTAMAIMILKERKLLNYDHMMIDYLPELGGDQFPYYNTISIRHLLNHTAGLPNYMYFVEKYKNRDEHPYNDEVVKLLADHKMGLNFRPGSRFSYSNTGYMVLALIAERVSGIPFAEFVEQNIFQPLDMQDSFVYSRSRGTRDSKLRLVGFKKYRRFYPIQETRHDGVVGDKGVYSTAADLFKWDRALYTESLVSSETLEEAFTPGKLTNGREIPYGFGFRLKGMGGNERVVYHNGLWNGFRTTFTRYVDDNSAVLIMDHTDCRAKHIIAEKIEKILLAQQLNLTQVLAEKAMDEGPEKAIQIFYTMSRMNQNLVISLEELKKTYLFLDEINKKQMASHIDKLMEAISLQVHS
ncbi:MAG: beta-lactamase family protein [Cyclobacteriaceae bacterium]|nr:beta-lactamase family protein [Cyclobacteriaceae bacterium]